MRSIKIKLTLAIFIALMLSTYERVYMVFLTGRTHCPSATPSANIGSVKFKINLRRGTVFLNCVI